MKVYIRRILKRVPINQFGKLGFEPFYEIVKTRDITPFNKRKRIKFFELEESLKGLIFADITTKISFKTLKANEIVTIHIKK